MERDSYTISADEDGMSLLDLLALRLHCSKRAAKNLLDRREVLVNQRRVWMARHRLEAKDQVTVPRPTGQGATRPGASADAPITRLFEDKHLLILNKPPDLLSNGRNSLETRLRDELDRDLIVAHRLDRDTSGCIVAARNAQVFEALKQIFRAAEVDKEYEALVYGCFPRSTTTIKRSLDGKSAETRVRVLAQTEGYSHLGLSILTGRTHQIRRHLSGLGYPLVGDKQFAGKLRIPEEAAGVSRQLLHARRIAFPHPVSGQPVTATAPFPDDFRTWKKSLLGRRK